MSNNYKINYINQMGGASVNGHLVWNGRDLIVNKKLCNTIVEEDKRKTYKYYQL